LRRAGAQEIADDNEARRNADSAGKLTATPGFQRRNRGHQFEPGHDGALGFALMRLRIAEIDEHPVAHVFCDKPAETVDRFADGAMISADHLAQILGIEPRGKGCRGDQIAKHHGKLAPLGGRPHPSLRRVRGRVREGAAQSSDRFQELAAMADRRDAKIPQILGRQARQNLHVDRILAEGRLVLREPQPPEPLRDLHRRPSFGLNITRIEEKRTRSASMLPLLGSAPPESGGEAHGAAAGFFEVPFGRGQRDAQVTRAARSKGVTREQRHILLPQQSPREILRAEPGAANVEEDEHPAFRRENPAIRGVCENPREQSRAATIGLAQQARFRQLVAQRRQGAILDEGRAAEIEA
jgi:hypothetical protein